MEREREREGGREIPVRARRSIAGESRANDNDNGSSDGNRYSSALSDDNRESAIRIAGIIENRRNPGGMSGY
jgi:hypothetical protein